MDASSASDYAVVLIICGVAALAAFIVHRAVTEPFPSVGIGVVPLGATIASLRSVSRFHSWVREGYRKHKAAIFRVRLLGEWNYVVSGRELVDELCRAPEDVLSFGEAVAHNFQADYTMGGWRTSAPVDGAIMRTKLNRTLDLTVPAAADELGAAFEDEITSRLNGEEWTSMSVGDAIMRVVCRGSNRMFVGLPLCRDREYVDLCVRYALDVFVSAMILRNLPAFLRPIGARLFVPVARTYARAQRLMTGHITRRLLETADGGIDLPDDYIQWVIETDKPSLKTVPALARHFLRLNLAAIHSTAVTFTFALYQLAAHHETYAEPIRREAQAVLSEHGWTKTGMDRLRLLDSFLHEVLRFHGINAVTLNRKAMRDYTFANGMVVRKGAIVSAAARATHRDPEIYAQADTFDGFRFYDTEPGAANCMTSTSAEFLSFGAGRHACAGRFWAANETKAMMAYMVSHYDMRMEQDGVVPPETWKGAAVIPDRNARILIRKRVPSE